VQHAFCLGNFKGRNLLGQLNVGGRISLKFLVRNSLGWGEEWVLFTRDRNDWTFGSVNCGEFVEGMGDC